MHAKESSLVYSFLLTYTNGHTCMCGVIKQESKQRTTYVLVPPLNLGVFESKNSQHRTDIGLLITIVIWLFKGQSCPDNYSSEEVGTSTVIHTVVNLGTRSDILVPWFEMMHCSSNLLWLYTYMVVALTLRWEEQIVLGVHVVAWWGDPEVSHLLAPGSLGEGQAWWVGYAEHRHWYMEGGRKRGREKYTQLH